MPQAISDSSLPDHEMRPSVAIGCVMCVLTIQSGAPTNQLEHEIEDLAHSLLRPHQHEGRSNNLNLVDWYTVW